jgi:fructoselysine-6-P-deglycase FrlB-like protein
MARLGQLVTSLPPSLRTLNGSPPQAPGLLVLAMSQSGRSADLVEALPVLHRGGACTVALVSDTAPPQAAAAGQVPPLHAGPEHSVATTKSFIAQLVAGRGCWRRGATTPGSPPRCGRCPRRWAAPPHKTGRPRCPCCSQPSSCS